MSRVRIPNVEREDRLLGGLTARQLAILAVPAVALWGIYVLTQRFLPLAAFVAVAVPVAVAAAVLALGRRDGLSADRLVLAAIRQACSPRRLVPAPEGVPRLPSWLAALASPIPASLELPARAVSQSGVVDLGSEGAAIVCEASSLNFGLRTEAEQDCLVGAFGRFLNSVAGPVEIVVRTERMDLREAVADLREVSGGLPHSALEATALDHARFLTELSARRDVLRRQVLVVFHEAASRTEAGSSLARRAEEGASSLAAAGITLRLLDGPEAAAALARASDPEAPARPVASGRGDVITSAGEMR